MGNERIVELLTMPEHVGYLAFFKDDQLEILGWNVRRQVGFVGMRSPDDSGHKGITQRVIIWVAWGRSEEKNGKRTNEARDEFPQ